MKQFVPLWAKLKEKTGHGSFETLFKALPDADLIALLERKRAKGRNDYSVSHLWKSILTSYLIPCPNLESLRRTLTTLSLPPSSACSRFTTSLLNHLTHIKVMRDRLLTRIADETPSLGTHLLLVEKPLPVPFSDKKEKPPNSRRSDHDADYGEQAIRQGGNMHLKRWYGYRHHLILDGKSGLPLASSITPASIKGTQHILTIMEKLRSRHPKLFKRAKYAIGEFAFDDPNLIQELWDIFGLKPIIELHPNYIKSKSTFCSIQDNAIYNDSGEIFCLSPGGRERHEMIYAGFEKSRKALKYRCLSTNYNVSCYGKQRCPVKSGIRIPLHLDRRLFTPVARSSYKWKQLFAHHKTQEYYLEYLENTLCLKLPYTRGLAKLQLHNLLNECLLLAHICQLHGWELLSPP